jgi:hypothetical protein
MTTVHPHPSATDPRKLPPNARPRNYQLVPPAPQAPLTSKADPFYGHESVAHLCARFITHLFTCPEYPPSSTHSQQKLPQFIAYALHRTKLHTSVTYASLVLLQRLKARFPTARGSSGHRLFISAFMIASKVICDDTYSNKSWSIVAQGMFNLREVNQMEREMCSYLDWELTVDNPILGNFEAAVNKDFCENRASYPDYPLAMVSKRAAKAATSSSATPMPEPNSTTSPIPNFGEQRNASPAKPHPGHPSHPSHIPTPSSVSSWGSTPNTPDTPSPSYSNSTSPASSVSPPTPVGGEDYSAKIRGVDSSPMFTITDIMPPVHPLKGQMFAFAHPSRW